MVGINPDSMCSFSRRAVNRSTKTLGNFNQGTDEIEPGCLEQGCSLARVGQRGFCPGTHTVCSSDVSMTLCFEYPHQVLAPGWSGVRQVA